MCISVKRFVILISIIFIFVNCYANVSTNLHANGGDIMEDKKSLVSLAKEIAVKEMIDVENSDIKMVQEDKFIIVEFHPKNINQLGGGGKLFFKIENGNYIFLKIELWQ